MKNLRLDRNIGTLSGAEQRKLGKSTAGIVGLGGIGSPAFEILVRMGVGKLVVFERDSFGETDFNRQLYAINRNLGKKKIEISAFKAMEINPKLKLEKHDARLDESNVHALAGCDVVVDGTDNLASRRIIAKFCIKHGIPYVFCSAGNAMGMCGVFVDADFGKVFGDAREPARKSVIAPAAIMAGTISASQAICVLLGKEYVKAPEFIFFDLFSPRILWRQKV